MASTLYNNLKALERLTPVRQSMSSISASRNLNEIQATRLNDLIATHLSCFCRLPPYQQYVRYDSVDLGVLIGVGKSLKASYGNYYPAFEYEQLEGLDEIMDRKVQQLCFLLEAHQDPPTLESVMALREVLDEIFMKTVRQMNMFIDVALSQEEEIAGLIQKEMLKHRRTDHSDCIQGSGGLALSLLDGTHATT